MSDTEIQDIYSKMLELFGFLPDYKQEPIRFAYYVKLFEYYQSKEI